MKLIKGDDHTCTADMILQKCILLDRDSLPHLQIAKWIFCSIKRAEYFHIYCSSLAVSDLLFSLILSMIFNVKWPCSPQNMVKRGERYPCIDFACIMSWHWTSRIISRLKTFYRTYFSRFNIFLGLEHSTYIIHLQVKAILPPYVRNSAKSSVWINIKKLPF